MRAARVAGRLATRDVTERGKRQPQQLPEHFLWIMGGDGIIEHLDMRLDVWSEFALRQDMEPCERPSCCGTIICGPRGAVAGPLAFDELIERHRRLPFAANATGRNSLRACWMICDPALMPRLAMTSATMRSGSLLPCRQHDTVKLTRNWFKWIIAEGLAAA